MGDTELPDDIAIYARRKLTKAASIFGPELLNQYAPFRPAIEAIQQTLDDAGSLPVEMFDACASASRMSANLVRNEVVPRPDQDAKINEFVTQIREIGADILGHDPKTQDILKRRNEITGNNALIENRDLITQVAGQLAEASEGPLQRIMERDAELATSMAVDADDRHDGSFRLSGKILRFLVLHPIAGTAALGAAVAGGKEIYWLGEKIITSPQFQTFLEAVMRWLGFG